MNHLMTGMHGGVGATSTMQLDWAVSHITQCLLDLLLN
jgi:hypothetical protein